MEVSLSGSHFEGSSLPSAPVPPVLPPVLPAFLPPPLLYTLLLLLLLFLHFKNFLAISKYRYFPLAPPDALLSTQICALETATLASGI